MPEIDFSALQTPDFATNALRAATLGRQEGLSLARTNALRTYASDPQAGISELMSVDPATAVTLQKADAEQRQTQAAIEAGRAAAGGDVAGARKIALASGNFTLSDQLDKMNETQRKVLSDAYGQLAATAQSVSSLPYAQRRAAIQSQAQRLQALGLPADRIDAFDPSDDNIRTLVQSSLGAKAQIDQARQAEIDAKPTYTEVQDGPNKNLVQTNPLADGAKYVPGVGFVGGSAAPAPDASQPPGGPLSAPPAVAQPDASAPRGLRNNNPLNLKPLAQGQWNGQTGVDNAGYAQFATPQDGFAAADKNLTAYATRHGINTIGGVIARWAPQGDGSNDPATYAQTVASSLGIKPDTPIDLTDPQVRQKVLTAMAQVENGQPVSLPTGPQAAPQAGSPQAQAPAGQPAPQAPVDGIPVAWQPRTVMTGRAEPKIQQVTTADGVVHTYDIADPQHPRELPIQGVANQPVQILTDPKTSTQYVYNPRTRQATTLDGKPYTPQGAAKIASGTVRSGAAMVMQKWAEEHPNATSAEYAQQYAKVGEMARAAIAFGSGPQGNMVRSFNVGIQHLDTFQRLADALQNGNVQALNAVKQEIAQQTGRSAPNSFEAAKQMVADEIVKAVIGGGGGVGDREKAQAAVSRANSPAQLRDVIATYKDLMAGQLAGLKRQYQTSTGGFDDFENMLAPETISSLEAHGASGGAPTPTGNRPPLSSFKR